MLYLKPGVRITGMRPEILLAAVAGERVFAQAGFDLCVWIFASRRACA